MPRSKRPTLDVPHTKPFDITGNGDAPAWRRAEPVAIAHQDRIANAHDYTTWFKALWSDEGIYFLVDCSDPRITSSGLPDLGQLWKEDVVEVFIWPDESVPIYFEYCISPLGSETPILVPDIDGAAMGWLPYAYHDGRRVQKAVGVRGGGAAPGARISAWTAEFFIPSKLLLPLRNAQPRRGMKWRANAFRIDYDQGKMCRFAWHNVGPSFHNFKEFPTLRFV